MCRVVVQPVLLLLLDHYDVDDYDEKLSGLPARGSYSGFWAKAASPSRDQTPSCQGGRGSGVGRSSPCQGGTSCLQKIYMIFIQSIRDTKKINDLIK